MDTQLRYNIKFSKLHEDEIAGTKITSTSEYRLSGIAQSTLPNFIAELGAKGYRLLVIWKENLREPNIS